MSRLMQMAATLGLSLFLAVSATAQTPAAKPALQTFPTAEAAAEALVTALRDDNDKAIAAILGKDWHAFVPSDAEDAEEVRAKFLAAWAEGHKIVPEGDDKVQVEVGKTGWVSPIPIVRDGGAWRYDPETGLKEVQARTIGRNELAVIQTLLSIVDAQREYVALDPMKVGVPVYARRLVSSPGRKDGLYWESKPGEPESPIGPLLAKAQLGAAPEKGYYGYRFRLLYSQGPNAPGGAYGYLVKDRMIGGFAVIAWPVKYGETGVMTFMVSQAGDVYERDLGPDTTQLAGAINVFDPDKEWQKADMTP